MANIIRRNPQDPSVQQQWEPFRMMRELMNWDPFAEMMPSLRGVEMPIFMPQFEVKETKDAYVFKADLPGVKEEDLDISLTGTRLTVSGKREAEEKKEDERFYAYERSYGSFTRAFTLPEGIDADHVEADMKSGVLTLTVPKRPETQPRKIALGGGAGRQQPEKSKAKA